MVRHTIVFANTMFKAICYNPSESQIITTGTDRKVRVGSLDFLMCLLFHVLKVEFQGQVARSMVSAIDWLRSIETYTFLWSLTQVSGNHALSNSGQKTPN